MDEARQLAQTIAEGAPLVVSAVKEMLRKTEDKPIKRMLPNAARWRIRRLSANDGFTGCC